MSERLLEPGIALCCDAEGRVTRVLHDGIAVGDLLSPGRSLLDAVDGESCGKARNFLSALRDEGAALDWQFQIAGPVRDQPLSLQWAGMAVVGGYLVTAARTFPAAARLLDTLAPRHGAERRGLAAGLREWSRWAGERSQQDAYLFDELSRLNNDLVTAHRELAKRNAELARLDAEKNRFLGIVAHDLRNPLSIVMAYSDFLGEEPGAVPDSGRRRFIDAIRRSSQFMLDLVDDLLDLAKIEAGKLVLDRAPTDLDRLVRENLDLNRTLAARQRRRLVYDAKGAVPPLLLDASKIEQVLNNLVGNAIKASPPEGTITVELAREADAALIRVTDQGPGIPAGELEAIFRPFQQGRVGTVAGGKSVGLGLAIAQSIVRGHGGRLWAESRPPDGASFFVRLPLSLAAGKPAPTDATP